ncbi:hypothetical protein ACFL29_02225 [Patescibacteria group bacterium]
MPDIDKTTNKEVIDKVKQESKPSLTVMPKEFRKAPEKKGISPKIFIFSGAGALIIIVGVVVTMLLTRSEPPPEPAPPEPPIVVEPEEPVATSTEPEEPGGSLIPITPTSTEEELPPELPTVPGELIQGTDLDSDGLTEKEEAAFQTDSKRPDTDSDGFLDGNEVFHLYNPAAIAPVNLVESGIVKAYANAAEGYTVFYPTLWATSSTSDTGRVSFLSDETESINITIVRASTAITLRSWYISEYPEKDINALQTYTSKHGYRGLQDANRLTTYIKEGEQVFIITYDLGGTNTLWYRRLYDMILNSLKIE